MLFLNKYLRELGINEKYWLFDKRTQEIDERFLPDEDGFVEAATFDLHSTFSLFIYSYMCYFRDHCLVSYPCGLTFEEYKKIIDDIIEGFKLMLIDEKEYRLQDSEGKRKYSKRRQRKIDRALRLFAKYYYCLWW
jgi:hypothetical protein